MLCVGLGLLACCMILPQVEANRRLAFEKQKLQFDLQHFETQVAVNQEFLDRLGSDPTLAERLAQRQMKMVREGSNVLELKGQTADGISPFLLVNVPPAPPLADYQPAGIFGRAFSDSRTRLYLLGVSLFMVAGVMVLSHTKS